MGFVRRFLVLPCFQSGGWHLLLPHATVPDMPINKASVDNDMNKTLLNLAVIDVCHPERCKKK
jgi:hypothetical protein